VALGSSAAAAYISRKPALASSWKPVRVITVCAAAGRLSAKVLELAAIHRSRRWWTSVGWQGTDLGQRAVEFQHYL